MQGFERPDRQLLDAAALAGHLVPAGSMFAFLAAHRAEVFPDGDYADLFAPRGVGRASVPATQMAAVMTLQALHDYSDRETAEAVRFDVRWKVAIGAPLDDAGFDPSTLVYWRRRIAKSKRPHRVSDAVKKVIEQTGVLEGRRRRAVDSTILADAVATQDTVTQLVSAIRRVAREVPGAAGQVEAVCKGHDYSQPGKPKIDWDDPAARDGLVTALVNDANALVTALKDAELDEDGESAMALLALVAGQDVEPADGSDGTDGRWRIARKVAEDRVISTVDADARHTRKSPQARRDGYRAHVAAEPETGIITDEELTKAAGEEQLRRRGRRADDLPGSGAGGGVRRLRLRHRRPARRPRRRPGTPRSSSPSRSSPPWRAGSPWTTSPPTSRPAPSPARTASPAASPPAVTSPSAPPAAPARCAPAAPRQDGRALILHQHDDLLRAARRAWRASPALREDYRKHRPNVERGSPRSPPGGDGASSSATAA